ncbi:MAG: HEPN domain-containing protein [Bacteroidales bacterium]|nr:HEPN domain-containing protein [Bacteroidales bacterium]MDD3702464.1 HEPN domain-containing protein [Bacteroidales bacterium]
MKLLKFLFKNGFWNSAVNRLYYAIFYAVNALLVLNVIDSQTHSGQRTQFSRHFIKTRKLDKKYGKLLVQLYDWRQQGDYENLFDFSKEAVIQLIEPVKEMLDTIDNEIKNSL